MRRVFFDAPVERQAWVFLAPRALDLGLSVEYRGEPQGQCGYEAYNRKPAHSKSSSSSVSRSAFSSEFMVPHSVTNILM